MHVNKAHNYLERAEKHLVEEKKQHQSSRKVYARMYAYVLSECLVVYNIKVYTKVNLIFLENVLYHVNWANHHRYNRFTNHNKSRIEQGKYSMSFMACQQYAYIIIKICQYVYIRVVVLHFKVLFYNFICTLKELLMSYKLELLRPTLAFLVYILFA